MAAKWLLLFVAAVCGSVLVEEAPERSPHWQLQGYPAPTTKLRFTFAMKQRNLSWLESTFWSVSDPKNPSYGRYLSMEAIRDMVAPLDANVDTLHKWLKDVGGYDVETSRSKDFVSAWMRAEDASKAFSVSMCWYQATKDSKIRVVRGCDGAYHLPEEVAAVVDFVGGLLHFPALRRMRRSARVAPNLGNTPSVLRKLYSIPAGTKANATGNSQCVTGFLNQWYSRADLQHFFKTYSPTQEGQKIVKVVGPNGANPGDEANLDVQYVMAMGDGVPTWWWSNDKKNPVNNQEPWVAFLEAVGNATDVPRLFSMSYGEGENTLTPVYMNRANVEFQKLGVRGITMMAASGDDGAGCVKQKFMPNFPSASPYLTAVGGTSGGPSERAAGLSSGGFSGTFAMPAYQKAAVETYLKSGHLPPQKYWNATGRAYPDVAAVAEDVPICLDGFCGEAVSGTSCASPTFAGVVGLLNDARLAAGKPALGFLNPLFYQLAAAGYPFNDITEGAGSSNGCGRQGWPAYKGWDAVTGWGSPNYEKLVKAVMSVV